MERFIFEANIAAFRQGLGNAVAPEERNLLEELLAERMARLAALDRSEKTT